MKTIGKLLALLIVLGLAFLIGWLIFIGAKYILIQFNEIDNRISSLIIVGSIVILLSASIIGWAIKSINYSGDRAIHPEKAIIYSKFIDLWIEIKNNDFANKEIQTKYQEIKKQMILWSNDLVLQKFIQFMDQINNKTSIDIISKSAEKVVLEIRKDLGEKNSGLKIGSITRLLE